VLLPNIFQPTDILDQSGVGAATQHFSTNRYFRPIGGGCCYCYPFFRPTFFGPLGGGRCSPTFFQPTDFLTWGRILTNRFLDRSGAGSANIFFQPADSQKITIPPYTPTRSPKTWGSISSSVNDRLDHGHQLSPLAPCTTVHYVTSSFGLIWNNITNLANIWGSRREWKSEDDEESSLVSG